MYRQLAAITTKIYHFKDYQKEAQKIETLIQQHKKSSGDQLLDVAMWNRESHRVSETALHSRRTRLQLGNAEDSS